MKSEEYCKILDYMPKGRSDAIKTEPIAQAIGKEFFTLLELVPKPSTYLEVGEDVYVGKEEREKIQLIKRRISFKDLTSNSVSEINDVIDSIVEENKEKYLNFFNNSRSFSIKRHQLEFLPTLGKKHVQEILGEREKELFKNFEDIVKRVKGMPDPKKGIVKRIIEELEDPEEKHFLFVRPPAAPKQHFQRRRY